jgi:hypothetical protein
LLVRGRVSAHKNSFQAIHGFIGSLYLFKFSITHDAFLSFTVPSSTGRRLKTRLFSLAKRPRRRLSPEILPGRFEMTVCGISLVSGNQEDVGVGNSPSPCIQGNKLGRKGLHEPLRSGFRQAGEAGGLLRGELVPPGHMASRDDQTMPLSQRIDVEKGEGEIVLENDLSRRPA